MTDVTSTHRVSDEETTVHYVAICKQIKALDDVIRNQHNRLTTATDRETLDILTALETAWRLRRQLCEDRPRAEHDFRTHHGYEHRAEIALERTEPQYR